MVSACMDVGFDPIVATEQALMLRKNTEYLIGIQDMNKIAQQKIDNKGLSSEQTQGKGRNQSIE